MKLLSPAKINLHLRVGPPGSDGFHPLVSWMTTVGLFDILTFSVRDRSRAGTSEIASGNVSLSCSDLTLPTDGRNLIVKAANALRKAIAVVDPARARALVDVDIHCEKRIPMGGGLGGGSGNAAVALMALNTLWSLDWSSEQLRQVAAEVGSDVAFFLFGPSSICTGRGQFVRPIATPKAKAVLLMLPGMPMATPAVYKTFDALLPRSESGSFSREWNDREPDWDAWMEMSATQLLPHLVNDLEPPAFAVEKDLNVLRLAIESELDRTVRMSGSGSTLFTIYDSLVEAENAATILSGATAERGASNSLRDAVSRLRLRGFEMKVVATTLAQV